MPFLSRHDIRTWLGMPNAQWSESQRACGALKLIHEPYNGQVAWDWVATELFSTLFSKQGGYIVAQYSLAYERSSECILQLPEKRDREALSDTLYPFL